MIKLILSGAAIDVLHKLFKYGDQDDGDLPSKSGMQELITKGLALKEYENEKPNSISEYGHYVYSKRLYKQSAETL